MSEGHDADVQDLQAEISSALKELECLNSETKDLLDGFSNLDEGVISTKNQQHNKFDAKTAKKVTSSWAKSQTRRIDITPRHQHDNNGGGYSVRIPSSVRGGNIAKDKRSINEVKNEGADQFYDANINVSSTKKRVPAARIIGKARSDTMSTTSVQNAIEPQSQQDVGCINFDGVEPSTKGFIFNTTSRETSAGFNYSEKGCESTLVVESEKFKFPRPKSATFSREKTNRQIEKVVTQDDQNISKTVGNIEVLSGRERAPSAKFYSGLIVDNRKKRLVVDVSHLGIPGPGAYHDGIDKYFIGKQTPTGIIGRKRGSPAKSRLLPQQTPGPGAYAVENADKLLVFNKFDLGSMFHSQSKIPPQLKRKHYWEEKAALLRNDHDDLKEASFSLVSRKIPTVSLHCDSKKGISYKNRRVIQRIQAERMREKELAYYDANYDAVERKIINSVSIERSQVSKQNTKQMLKNAGILLPEERMKIEKSHGADYLGPQLHVPWIENRDSSVSGENEQLAAYMRSSFSGNIVHKSTHVMRDSKHENRSSYIGNNAHQNNLEYLSTQIHQDWKEIPNFSTNIKTMTGRDILKVRSKGTVEKMSFNEPTHQVGDEIGPGYYDLNDSFGTKIAGGVKFDLAAGRNERDSDVPLEMEGDLLDLDAIGAKESTKKKVASFTLYAKDREAKEKERNEAFHHLGGSYVESKGTVTNTIVNYDMMSGRNDEVAISSVNDDADIHEGHVLDLEVKSWKPHKPNTSQIPAWESDVPRFKQAVSEGPVSTLQPLYDAIRPRKVYPISFDQQSERWKRDVEEQGIVENDVGVEFASNVAELDELLEKGFQMQSGQSKVRNVDFEKFQERKLTNLRTEAPDVIYNVNYNVVDGKTAKSVLAWKDQPNRNLLKDEIQSELDGTVEELILRPNSDSNNRVKGALDWKKQEDKGYQAAIEADEMLDIEPNHEFGKVKTLTGYPNMSQQLSRFNHSDNKNNNQVFTEELDLEPNFNYLKPFKGEGSKRGGVSWKKTKDEFSDVFMSEIYDEELKINISLGDPLPPKNPKGIAFGAEVQFAGPLSSIEQNFEELMISPDRPQIGLGHNSQTAWKKEFKSDYQKADGDNLILSPQKSSRIKVKGASWGNSRREDDRKSFFSLPEEVVIEAKNVTYEAKADATWAKRKEDDVVEQTAEKEELILSPKLVGRNKRNIVSWNHNTFNDAMMRQKQKKASGINLNKGKTKKTNVDATK